MQWDLGAANVVKTMVLLSETEAVERSAPAWLCTKLQHECCGDELACLRDTEVENVA
jgi:hypothetical protein